MQKLVQELLLSKMVNGLTLLHERSNFVQEQIINGYSSSSQLLNLSKSSLIYFVNIKKVHSS